MPTKHADTDAVVPGRVHGVNRADDDQLVPRSLWAACVGGVGHFVELLREVFVKPDEPDFAGQPHKSHLCTSDAGRICTCARGVCADDSATYRYARGVRPRVDIPKPNALGNFRCPISGQLCSADVCREWCEGSGGTGPAADLRGRNA